MTERPTKQFFKEAINYLTPFVKQAGEMILESWNKIEIAKQKDVRDVATKTDVAVENFLKEKILFKWPSHGFWGEEGEKRINPSSSYQWLVDPIDGTKFYVGLAPFFQTFIALTFNGAPVLGLMYHPLSRQFFSAYQGGGTYLNGKIILVKSSFFLNEAVVDVDFGGLLDKKEEEKKWMLDKLSRIIERSYRVRMSAGALSTYIVTGAIDAYIDLAGSKPQEIAARIIIAQEAGLKTEKIKTAFGEKLVVSREPALSEIKQILLK
ncbi:MAG: inositol monophosphatase family protein [Patescibacteria group bacterium]